MNARRVGAALALASVTLACTGETPSHPAAANSELRDLDPALSASSVRGRVRFEGEIPQPSIVRMNADPYCAGANPEGRAAVREVDAAADGSLAGVLVHVSKGLEGYRFAPPSDPVVLDQARCAYVPRVFGIQLGQTLELRNSDDTLHNVHAVARGGDRFNLGMPAKGMTLRETFESPAVFVRVKCDVHPWMAAYAGVVSNPFHTLTAPDGSYVIEGLPAGTYTIDAAHPTLGSQHAQVTVGERAAVQADFAFAK